MVCQVCCIHTYDMSGNYMHTYDISGMLYTYDICQVCYIHTYDMSGLYISKKQTSQCHVCIVCAVKFDTAAQY